MLPPAMDEGRYECAGAYSSNKFRAHCRVTYYLKKHGGAEPRARIYLG